MKIKNENLANLLEVSKQSISNYKREKPRLIEFFYRYFTNENIEDFLEFNEINKFEKIKELDDKELNTIVINSFSFKILNLKEIEKRVLRKYLKYSKDNDISIKESIYKVTRQTKVLKTIKEIFINNSDDFLIKKDFENFKKIYFDFKHFEIELLEKRKEHFINFITKNLKNKIF